MLKPIVAAALLLVLAPAGSPSFAQKKEASAAQEEQYRIKVTTEVVLVNVVVRDKDGKPISGLKRDDFIVLEDNKPQNVVSFDFENIDAAALPPTLPTGPGQAVLDVRQPSVQKPALDDTALRDRRLVVLFFDESGMETDEIERSVVAAQKYVDQQMSPADLVAIATFSSALKVDQDFTADRKRLKQVLDDINPAGGAGTQAGETGDTANGADNAEAFTPDESDYNVFNTDRKIEALGSLADAMARIQQKKSIVYFSNGVSKSGMDNESELRSAINRAVKANVAIYPVDIRGLQAMPPGGEARQASQRGTGAYSGAAVRAQFDSSFASQETLVTLAADTGGKAFMDSNDFGKVFDRVQRDTATYYVLGYHSANPLRDGRYRRITVRMKNPGAYKLEFRSGYYAPRDFAHATNEDRESQLQTELANDLSATDLRMYLSAAYFRVDDAHFFVPVAIVIPGSEIPFTRAADKDKATLDVIGVVRNEIKMPVGSVRDTIRLNVDETQQVRRKNVQYRTGFTLAPGNYHLKFVVRENQTGRLGSFEADISIPDLRKAPLRLSSVLIGNQLAPAKGKNDPLVHDGQELVPSLSHVFTANQKLYFYYEVYEPARAKAVPPNGAAPAGAPSGNEKNAVYLLTSISFFNGKVKTYETPLVEARELNTPQRKAAVFQFEVPLEKLRPGFYTCQVNVIDDAAGAFAFPRLALLVRPKPETPAPPPTTNQ